MARRIDPLNGDPAPLIRRIYRYVADRIGGLDAEDVAAELFERAIWYQISYAPKGSAPTVWLTPIATPRPRGQGRPAPSRAYPMRPTRLTSRPKACNNSTSRRPAPTLGARPPVHRT